MIDGGVDVNLDSDYEGLSIVGLPDIGPYEFGHGDADSDGISDYDEVCYDGNCQSYNPYHPSTNSTGTDLDMNNADTDGDGDSDSAEIAANSDPLNALSTRPALPVAAPVLSWGMQLLLVLIMLWLGWCQVLARTHSN